MPGHRFSPGIDDDEAVRAPTSGRRPPLKSRLAHHLGDQDQHLDSAGRSRQPGEVR
jgi:hypothetical protein